MSKHNHLPLMAYNSLLEQFEQKPGSAQPIGQWIRKEEDRYVAIDNSDGNVWVEEFKTRDKAVKWLEAKE